MVTKSTYLIYHHKAWNWNDAHQRTGAPPGTVSSQCGSTCRGSPPKLVGLLLFFTVRGPRPVAAIRKKPCEISIHNKKHSSQSTCVFHLFFYLVFFSDCGIVTKWMRYIIASFLWFLDPNRQQEPRWRWLRVGRHTAILVLLGRADLALWIPSFGGKIRWTRYFEGVEVATVTKFNKQSDVKVDMMRRLDKARYSALFMGFICVYPNGLLYSNYQNSKLWCHKTALHPKDLDHVLVVVT